MLSVFPRSCYIQQMQDQTKCPKCSSEGIYPDGTLWVCPDCNYEWSALSNAIKSDEANDPNDSVIKDAHGNQLNDGDSVSVVKDLKIKGASSVVKVGTKVKNIRLVESSDGHNISCKIDGIGAINLKSEYVKKI